LPPEGSGLPEPAASTRSARRALRAELDLCFAADGTGRSYIKRQFAAYPFHVCRALYQDPEQPGLATLYVQSCSGGIYEDDQLTTTLAVEAGARVHVSTQAATVVHSMPSSHASQRVSLACGDGAYVEFLPDPQILFPRSRFRSEIDIRLGEKSVAVVSDAFLTHDPNGGSDVFDAYFNEIAVKDAGGELLAVDRLKVRGESFRKAAPGTFGSFKAQATMIVAGRDLAASPIVAGLKRLGSDGATLGVSELPHDAGLIVRVLAADGCALERMMHETWSNVRLALMGAPPRRRRK